MLVAVEDGADVVITATGSINTDGLSYDGTAFDDATLASGAGLLVGSAGTFDIYLGAISGDPFGASFVGVDAASGLGDMVGVNFFSDLIAVPVGYISGAALSGGARWVGESFASLSMNPGSYTWTWGSGANADSATLVVGAAPLPSTAALLAVGGLALRRRVGR